MGNQPLSGIKVIDLSQWVSGPYCTKLLADFGAQVIKVEDPNGGDVSRRHGPFPGDIPHAEKSGLFLYLNSNKRGITLNLGCRAGINILEHLAADADVIVENLGPAESERLRLTYESLRRANRSVIVTSISYFGQDGPYRDYTGSDIVAQAMGGLMHPTGLAGREPLKIAGEQAGYQAGINAAVATLAALHFRDETGMGQQIDVSVMEALASILEGRLLGYAYDRVVVGRTRTGHPSVYPPAILPCKDGHVHVHASADWQAFCRFAPIPDLLAREPGDASLNPKEIDEVLIGWLQDKGMEEVFQEAQAWRLPFGMVLGIDQLVADRHLREREFFATSDHPVAGPLTYPGAPFKASSGWWKSVRAPLLGEHNAEVYGGCLGFTNCDLVRLRAMGVI